MELDNLNAPQFVDFTKPLDDDSEDSYFGKVFGCHKNVYKYVNKQWPASVAMFYL